MIKTTTKTRKQHRKGGMDCFKEKACQEYVLNGGDQSKAYRVAYPASKRWKDSTVWSRASQLFAESKVQARVAELQSEAAKVAEEKFKVDAEYVLGRLVEIDQMDVADILDNVGNILPVKDWPKSWRTTLSGLDIQEIMSGDTESVVRKIKWPDKVKNLEMLGKHVSVNAFREQVGLSDPLGGPVKTTIVFEGVGADAD